MSVSFKNFDEFENAQSCTKQIKRSVGKLVQSNNVINAKIIDQGLK